MHLNIQYVDVCFVLFLFFRGGGGAGAAAAAASVVFLVCGELQEGGSGRGGNVGC